jgi:putative MATE family efflux protein
MPQNRRSLTEGSIPRTLFLFSLPILAGNVFQTLDGSINAIWVGKFLGEGALSAVSNANIVMFLVLGAVFGLSMAATILVAQRVGARDITEAKRVVGTSATFFFGIALVIAVLGLALLRPVLGFLRVPDDAVAYAISYMRILLAALPLSFMYYYLMAVLRGTGDSRTPFKFLTLSVALGIVLNPLLIFGIGPFPRLGIAGSATAAVTAQAISLGLMLRQLYRRRNPLRLHRNELVLLRPDWGIVRTLVAKGVPMGLQMVVMSSSMLAMMGLVNRYGSHVTAAFGAALQVWNYVQMPGLAIGAAATAMAAQNVGAGQWTRVEETAKAGIAYGFLVTGSICLVLYLLARPVLSLFLPGNSATLDIAVHINAIALWGYMFFGVTMVLIGVVRSTGAVMPPVILLFISLWVIRYPFALALLDRLGADAIWWSFPFGSIVSVSLAYLYYRRGGWRSARMGAPAS